MHDDGRERAADRSRHVELVDHLRHGLGDRVRRRRLRGRDADAPAGGAGREVDQRGLDARTTDVDTDERLRGRHRPDATPAQRYGTSDRRRAVVAPGGSVRRMVDRPARLEDYALLGDCRSAALVSRAGSVDWWCVPRFDDAACFAALLGTPDHGRFLIAPARARASRAGGTAPTRWCSRPNTTPTPAGCASSTVSCSGGNGRCWCASSKASAARSRCTWSWSCASTTARSCRGSGGSTVRWRAVAGPDGLELFTPLELTGENFKTTAEFSVGRRDQVPFVLGWFPSHDPKPVPRRCRSAGRRHDEAVARMDRAVASTTASGASRSPAIAAHARVAHVSRRPAASSPRRPRRCRSSWAGRGTGTTATAGYATRRSRSRRSSSAGYDHEAVRWRELAAPRGRRPSPRTLQTMYGVGGRAAAHRARARLAAGLRRLASGAHGQRARTANSSSTCTASSPTLLWQAVRADMPPSDRVVVAAAAAARVARSSGGASPTKGSGRCAAGAGTSRTRR